MKWLATLVFVPSMAIAQTAPFCVVSANANNCWYYTASSCEQAAKSINGACVVNNTAQANPPTSVFDSFQRGREAGERRRREEEEHQAKLALLAAQTRSATQPPAPTYVQVRYRCSDGSGGSYETMQATVGCVVLEITPIR